MGGESRDHQLTPVGYLNAINQTHRPVCSGGGVVGVDGGLDVWLRLLESRGHLQPLKNQHHQMGGGDVWMREFVMVNVAMVNSSMDGWLMNDGSVEVEKKILVAAATTNPGECTGENA